MKTAFAIFIILHGIIHFMGFSKAFKLAEISQLNQYIGKTAGAFWLLAGLLFLVSAILVFSRNEWWWVPGLAAVVISQILILLSWQDARYGTIANLIIFITLVAGFGTWNFHRSFINDYKQSLSRTERITNEPLTNSDIQHLPLPVKRYLTYAGVLNHDKVKNALIRFNGEMRSKKMDWFKFQSVQYNFYDVPSRLFYMTAQIKGLNVSGYHSYKNGIASMQIKPFGLFPFVDEKGEMLDKTETVTLFNDMCLISPATLIDKSIIWEEIDSLSTKAYFTCNGITISAILYFNKTGQLVNFISNDRYDMSGDTAVNYRFSTPVYDYKNINGINIFTRGEAIWHYPEGEFVYGKFYLESIAYNINR